MPRRARHYIAHQPYHIVQRGNNREACFIELENYQFYLELWKELSKKFGVFVHTYCLMTNHVHLLVTPETEDAISVVMRQVVAVMPSMSIKNTGVPELFGKDAISPV